MPGIPSNFQEILQQAQKMQEQFAKLQGELATKEIEASAGGGMVTVRINGNLQIASITIEKTVVNPNDVEMLQDLIAAAVNEGLRKAKQMFQEELMKVTGGLPIPGMMP